MTAGTAMTDFAAEPLHTARLGLEVLRVGHAEEAAAAFASPALHEFIGGSPSTAVDLAARYARLEKGRSDDGTQLWFNWMLRERETGLLVGTVQATVEEAHTSVAWVVGQPFQRRGYATEAAKAIAAWLRGRGLGPIRAFVHPRNDASAAIAAHLGLTETSTVLDGENLWIDPARA